MPISRLAKLLILSCALTVLPGAGVVDDAFAHVTAADVIDRSTLRTFVERAHALVQPQVRWMTKRQAYDVFKQHFWPEGEWKRGDVYMYVIDAEGADRGVNLFHGANLTLENANLWEFVDKNGVKYVQELIRVALAGGGYVDYFFDNPVVPGDEEEGSLKVGYAQIIEIAGDKYIIGSGIYPKTSVPFAPPLAYALLALLLAGGGAFFRRRAASRGLHGG